MSIDSVRSTKNAPAGLLTSISSRDQASAISLELKELGQLQRDLGIHFDATLDRIQTDILQLTEQRVSASEISQLARLKDCLNELEAERSLRRRQACLIPSLYFWEIRRRWEQIPAADELSNAWLFDRTKTDFMDWLESGNGIYWITGKVRTFVFLPSSPSTWVPVIAYLT